MGVNHFFLLIFVLHHFAYMVHPAKSIVTKGHRCILSSICLMVCVIVENAKRKGFML